MNKGQVALEYFLVMGIVILLSVVYLVITANVHQRTVDSAVQSDLEDIVQRIQDELFIASQVRDGYTRTIDLPVLVREQPYFIIHSSSIVTARQSSHSASRSVPDFSGNISIGMNTLTKQNGSIMFV